MIPSKKRLKLQRCRRGVLIALVCASAFNSGACGSAEAEKVGEPAMHTRGASMPMRHGAHEAGSIKAVRWSILKTKGRSIRLSALVPYCGYDRPKPHVERVTSHNKRHGLVLTMFVWFPPKPSKGGCIYVNIGVVSPWIRLSAAPDQVPLYDGKTSPPEQRS